MTCGLPDTVSHVTSVEAAKSTEKSMNNRVRFVAFRTTCSSMLILNTMTRFRASQNLPSEKKPYLLFAAEGERSASSVLTAYMCPPTCVCQDVSADMCPPTCVHRHVSADMYPQTCVHRHVSADIRNIQTLLHTASTHFLIFNASGPRMPRSKRTWCNVPQSRI